MNFVVKRPSDNFLDETIAFWQPRMQRELSREDARQISENLSGFFQVLLEWDAKRKCNQTTTDRVFADLSNLPIQPASSKLKASISRP
jgi:hypothetical protein